MTYTFETTMDLINYCIDNKIYVLSDETYMFLNLESYGLQEVSKPLFHYVMNSGNSNTNSTREDYVISMNSFSYLIVPGVRTGWI